MRRSSQQGCGGCSDKLSAGVRGLVKKDLTVVYILVVKTNKTLIEKICKVLFHFTLSLY